MAAAYSFQMLHHVEANKVFPKVAGLNYILGLLLAWNLNYMDDFDLLRVCTLFEKCLDEKFDLNAYIEGFWELNK